MKRDRDDVLFAIGLALWIAIIALTWPRALSFGDEVGYVARAKLLLEGHLGYVAHSPGVWLPSPHGLVAKFPLALSVILAPFVALTPRAVFAVPVLSAVLLATTARAALKSWGKSPLWALLMLGHPTIVILARTAMADVPQAAAAACAWWACRRSRPIAALAWLVVLVVLKQTGGVLAIAIVAGEGITNLRRLRARDAVAWRGLGAGIAGGLLGFALSLFQNWIGTGTVRSAGYDAVFEQIRPFALSYLPARLGAHLTTLLFVPPLLVAGAWPFWRRRDFGPLFVVGGYLAMMCLYYFSDTGANRLETLVLSPRLILPVVVFLLIGYGAWLDDLTRGVRADPPRLRAWLAVMLIAVPLVVTAAISLRHARYQRAMGEISAAASARADAQPGGTLGVTENACKAGLLHDGPTTIFDPISNPTTVVLCSAVSASHRAQDWKRQSCVIAGYHVVTSRDGYYALERDATP